MSTHNICFHEDTVFSLIYALGALQFIAAKMTILSLSKIC